MPHNKNHIKSEYSKSFKTYKEKAQTEYNENVKFRLARRDREVTHQPWAWLDVGISEDDESEAYVSVESGARHLNENSDETDSNFDASGAVDNKDNSGAESDDFVEQLKERAMRRVKEMCSKNESTQKNQSHDILYRPHHPTKGFKKEMPRSQSLEHRPKSSNHVPTKVVSNISNMKPFISYGWGTKSLENGRKKTFNINSDIDVHPSAIRALKHLETKKQQKHESVMTNARPRTADQSKSSDHRRSSHSADINGGGDDRSPDWRSEYQHRYPTYTDEVYRRCLANVAARGHSARLNTPGTCRI